jgi:magnesium-protoporphyrin IX monomethyl ester (oxidative) cyclase
MDDPRSRKSLDRLPRIAKASDASREEGGVIGRIERAGLAARRALVFAHDLYLLPGRANEAPSQVRAAPAG